MDYEKKYKEAIERAKIWQEHLYDVNDKDYADELNYIFPELAESEDEKIRKRLIEEMRRFQREVARQSCDADFEFAKSAIAWLEKQGEQKPVELNERYIAEVFEKVGLAKVVRELANDNLTNALQDAMIELSKFTPQPRQEWSKEDEKMLDKMRDYFMSFLGDKPDFTDDKRYEGFVEFIDHRLKSLRPKKFSNVERNGEKWKPSEEQMKALYDLIPVGEYLSEKEILLYSLYNKLKEL